MENFKMSKALIVGVILSIVGLSVVGGSFYTVDEGHVGIVKTFSEAKKQVDAGLHFKVPFIDDVQEMEIRTRKNIEKMASSTSEQMPATVTVSVNWTVDKAHALSLYKQYGGLEQFEKRILDPRFRASVKQTVPKYTAEQLIRDRAAATMIIEASLIEEMKDFPVTVDNIQIEDVKLPQKYLQSIETKQTEKNLADAENHKLERQRLESLREVNTSDAKAQGILKVAEAEAKSIRLKGSAEAFAITAKAKALKSNPLIVELEQAKRWGGVLPTHITSMGKGTALPILNLNK